MMVVYRFLTSRGFAIALLGLSLVLLIIWNTHPDLYTPFFLVVPAVLFLSISFCTLRRVLARRGRWGLAFSGSMVFHLGLLVIIAATAMGLLVRFWAAVALLDGITVTLEDERYAVIHSVPLGESVPVISLRLDSVESRYEMGWYPVERTASLSIGIMDEVGMSITEETMGVNSPVWKMGYQFMLVSGGYTPRFVLRDGGEVAFDEFVEVSNDSDEEGSFEIPEAGLTVYTRFFPDMFKEGTKYGTRSPEPRNPAFGIKITRAARDPFKDLWRGVLQEGEKAEFGGFVLEFAGLKPFVGIQVMKDPTYYGIFAGWALIVVGLTVRFLPLLVGGKEVKRPIGATALKAGERP